ncbi:Peptidyl-prolyl cis-trans isomerase D [Geodia barretti]|uniref:Periplasmic chaperone PpiD n=1 Tax=Geodia barretti TaxID=519541 RepID=A0AA35SVJ3_GEOBA|nr:Peptidyl-prolyl cis-trans isomerase D [Geodia barretti]
MWIIAIVFLVGTVFLYSNTRGGDGDPEGEVVLKINNAEVKRGEFESAVANAMESQRQNQRFGAPDKEQIQKNVIDRWVQQTILGSVDIGDAEVKNYIRSDASRVEEYNLYQQWGVADLYTDNVRLQLSTDALRNSVQALELVTDTEAERAYQLEADKAKIKFIEFKYNDYTSMIEVDDAAAKAYFEENRDNYKVEEQVNVKFIKVNPADLVSDEDIRTYYEENQKEFTTPEAVKARHILKKFPDNATDEQKAETKTAAEELLKTVNAELAAGADFAELAKKHSEGPSGAQGGALRGGNLKLPPGDYFARGDMVKPFEEAAFDTLKPGEVSGLVETSYGYHIIKLEEKKSPEIQPFEQAQFEIGQKLVQVSGVDKAKKVAEDLLFDIEIQDYDKALALEAYKQLSLAALETGFFSRDATTIPQIGATWGYQGLVDELFDMEVNVSQVIEAKKRTGQEVEAYFVATILDKKPAAIPPFEEIKKELVEREEPDVEAFKTDPAEKARHRQALIQAKKREAYLNWFAARKEASELWIHQDYR